MSKKRKNENIVFNVSVLLTVAFIIWGSFYREPFNYYHYLFNGTIDYFGWIYLGAAIFFVLFSVYLLFSKYGHIRLGKETDKPEFKTGSWLAMLLVQVRE